jgi:NADH:ubiquinone oxidoreductase subunit E
MSPVNVRICLGTTCFVMGSGQLQSLFDDLPAQFGEDKVNVIGERCFELCSAADSFAKAPFVMVDDEVISSADHNKVVEAVKRHLEEKK